MCFQFPFGHAQRHDAQQAGGRLFYTAGPLNAKLCCPVDVRTPGNWMQTAQPWTICATGTLSDYVSIAFSYLLMTDGVV